MTDTKKTSISFYLPTEQAEQLKRVAYQANTSTSEVLRQLLDDPHNQAKLRRAARAKHGIFQ